MKVILAIVFALALGFATQAQSTTHTDCTFGGNTADCNSTTTDNGAAAAEAGRDAGTAIGGIIGRIKANKEAKKQAQQQAAQRAAQQAAAQDRAKINIVFCQQNPDESFTNSKGEKETCVEAAKREVAICTVTPSVLCDFFATHRAVVKPEEK